MNSQTKVFIVLLSSLVLGGCVSADWVKHPNEAFTTSKYAPESERTSNGIGIVRYLNEGHSSVIESRKEDAFKKAYEACNGKYEIVKKLDSETAPTYFSQFNNATNMVTTWGVSSSYKYIAFRCL